MSAPARNPPVRKRKIIIDTDAGGDDVVGILTAAADPNTEIVAMTAVWGNVRVDQGIKNLGVVADAISASNGRDIPIFIGADGPLLQGERETVQWYGFGEDGMGDAGFMPSPRVGEAQRKPHASLAIVNILSNIKDDDPHLWQVHAIGPLTNLAIALNLKPDLFRNLGGARHGTDEPGLIVMGGASQGKGNASLCAEFNFACDPDAARAVFQNSRGHLRNPIMVISWELTVDAALPWELFDRMLGRPVRQKSMSSFLSSSQRGSQPLGLESAGTTPSSSGAAAPPTANGCFDLENPPHGYAPASAWREELTRCERNERICAFLGKVLHKFEEVSRPKGGDAVDLGDEERTQDTCVVCDAVSIAVGLNPSVVKQKVRTFATVETQGANTRGMLCISWYGNEKSLAAKGQFVNCDVVQKIDINQMLVSIARIVHIGRG